MLTEQIKIPSVSASPVVSADEKTIYLSSGSKLTVYSLAQLARLQELPLRVGTTGLSHDGKRFFWIDGTGVNKRSVTLRMFSVNRCLRSCMPSRSQTLDHIWISPAFPGTTGMFSCFRRNGVFGAWIALLCKLS